MKQKMKKLLAVLAVFVFALQTGGGLVQAETISGDKGDLSITSDAEYIYFTYEGSWSSYVSEKVQVAVDGANLDKLKTLSFDMSAEKDSGKVDVRNAWSGAVQGASGTFTCSDKKQSYGYEKLKWTVKVPLSTYEAFNPEKMTFTWGGKSTTLTVKEEVTTVVTTEEMTTEQVTTEKTTEITSETGSEATTEISTETTETTTEATTGATTEVTTEITSEETTEKTTEEGTTEESGGTEGGDIIVTGGVQIDGMYDDWEGYPKTVLQYFEYTSHYGQMFTDGEYIYAHFKAADNYTSHIAITRWELRINGQDFALRMLQVNNNGEVISTDPPTRPGEYMDRKVFFDYGWNTECDSQVAYTIYDDGRGDDIEFRISLEKLAEYTGIPVDQMGTISIGHTNLGGYVTTAGSSTGPVAGVMVAAMLALTYFKKKKEMREV